jgi:glucan 1,3-beta-glucosidase
MFFGRLQQFFGETVMRRFGSVPATPVQGPAIRGVNLGGWLVLEKWMTPELFKDSTAADEYSFCQDATPALLKRLRKHRDNFITREDFVWLAAHGVTAVRLPVGYWVFGDAEPYQPTVQWVDKACMWAQETGIGVLLDFHGAPGSQNGQDHSGRIGEVGWDMDVGNVNRSLQVLKSLAERYGAHPALLGFELLNEPSPGLDRRILIDYYESAYKVIRDECGDEPWVIFSDGFRPRRWRHVLRGQEYKGVFIDTHQYQTFAAADKRLSPAGHLAKTATEVVRSLRDMVRYHPTIVGEWNLTLDPQSLKNPDGVVLDEYQKTIVYRAYASAQLLAYGETSAWFFWSYKTSGGGTQSFRDVVERGWLPTPADNARETAHVTARTIR